MAPRNGPSRCPPARRATPTATATASGMNGSRIASTLVDAVDAGRRALVDGALVGGCRGGDDEVGRRPQHRHQAVAGVRALRDHPREGGVGDRHDHEPGGDELQRAAGSGGAPLEHQHGQGGQHDVGQRVGDRDGVRQQRLTVAAHRRTEGERPADEQRRAGDEAAVEDAAHAEPARAGAARSAGARRRRTAPPRGRRRRRSTGTAPRRPARPPRSSRAPPPAPTGPRAIVSEVQP